MNPEQEIINKKKEMKRLFVIVGYALTVFCADSIMAQTENCFKNEQMCKGTSSSCQRFPWIVAPDTLLSGKFITCPQDDQMSVTIPFLVKDPDNIIPTDNMVFHGITTSFSLQGNALSMEILMQGYENFPFHVSIKLEPADLEKFVKFQKTLKRAKKKKL